MFLPAARFFSVCLRRWAFLDLFACAALVSSVCLLGAYCLFAWGVGLSLNC
jgi:hypothetical protein